MALSSDTKPIWTSQTAWGALASIGAGLGTAIYAYRMGDSGAALSSFVAAFGGITALIGRIKATSKIGMAIESTISIADQVLVNYASSQPHSATEPGGGGGNYKDIPNGTRPTGSDPAT